MTIAIRTVDDRLSDAVVLVMGDVTLCLRVASDLGRFEALRRARVLRRGVVCSYLPAAGRSSRGPASGFRGDPILARCSAAGDAAWSAGRENRGGRGASPRSGYRQTRWSIYRDEPRR